MMRLTPEQRSWLQEAYRDQTNFDSDDPCAPIDPETYHWPEGDRLIHVAAIRGDLKTIEVLISAGENVNSVGDMGKTPAHYAAAGQHRAAFQFLMSHGADASIVDEFGDTPAETWALFERDAGPSD